MAAAIPLIIAILTALPSLIQAAEELHAAKGGGPLKKGFVLDAIGKIIDVARVAEPKLAKVLTPEVTQQIQTVSDKAIDGAVAVMNAAEPAKPAA
jgi:hypothetical protein